MTNDPNRKGTPTSSSREESADQNARQGGKAQGDGFESGKAATKPGKTGESSGSGGTGSSTEAGGFGGEGQSKKAAPGGVEGSASPDRSSGPDDTFVEA